MSRSTFFLSQLRFLKSRLFSRDLDVSRFLSRSSRQIKTFEIFEGYQDFVEINRDVVETFRTFFGFSKQKFEFPTLFAHFEANFEAKK
jgi:hypothetical protein